MFLTKRFLKIVYIRANFLFQNRHFLFSEDSFYREDLEHITHSFLILVNKVIM